MALSKEYELIGSVLRFISLILTLFLLLVSCSQTPQVMDTYSGPIALTQPRDLWSSIRTNLRITDQSKHIAVKKQIDWIKHHQADFNKLAVRAAPYLYYIHHEVEKRDLPSELALLPIIESAYDPFAYSNQGAAGLWQLMPGTAMGFGLSQNWWYDGRRDIYESTKAALDYVTYLNKYFDGDWLLTLAAYDSGEGTVRKAMRRNMSLKRDQQFWSLSLPRETKAYIPRLLAIATIIKYPERYGIELPKIMDTAYFSRLKVGFQIDLNRVAELSGVPKKEIYKLNPGYNRWATGPDGPHYIVLPINAVEQFKMNLENLPKQQRVKWRSYHVQANDNLGFIAKKFNVRVAELKRANKLKSDVIHINQRLVIPYGHNKPSNRELNKALAKQHKFGPKKVVYWANKNERITQIARKFSVTPGAIRFWNRLSSDKLASSQKIYIWKSKRSRKSSGRMYVVRSGDSLSTIAHKHRLSIAQLKAKNPQLKTTVIKPKDKLSV